jgi:hypothetical protein
VIPSRFVPLELWRRPDFRLLASGYAVEEARRNLDTPERRDRLERQLAAIELLTEAPNTPLPDAVRLPEKDEPILRAAIAAKATHLLTGDIRDFGHLLGRRVGDLLVQTPGGFLRSR